MLTAVSLGPGDSALLTPAAKEAIAKAEVVAGYKGYVALVDPALLEGKEVISTGMTGEVDRARQAVEAARSGRRTVMVCSGDAGIYAMAGLLLEILEAEGLLESVPFSVLPGVPAFGAAAALLGAPLMHDFASVSLSDLLTAVGGHRKTAATGGGGGLRHRHLQPALQEAERSPGKGARHHRRVPRAGHARGHRGPRLAGRAARGRRPSQGGGPGGRGHADRARGGQLRHPHGRGVYAYPARVSPQV